MSDEEMPDGKNVTKLSGTSRFRPRWMKAAISRMMSFGYGHRIPTSFGVLSET